MEQVTKFGRGTTLKQGIDEIEENGMYEITRIMSKDGVFTFEYNIE
jgi:hypothetical protein